MITWTEFARQQPALAAAGRGQIYQHGLGLAVSGRATEITGKQETWGTVGDQVIADFGELWPDYDSLALFELSVESCLLTLTEPDGTFAKGPIVWKV